MIENSTGVSGRCNHEGQGDEGFLRNRARILREAQLIKTWSLDPVLRPDIKRRKDPWINDHLDLAGLMGLETDLAPSDQPRLPCRGFDVDLGRIDTRSIGDVGNPETELQGGCALSSKVVGAKPRVGKAIAEREKRLSVRLFKPAIADIGAFGIMDREWRRVRTAASPFSGR